MRETYGIQDSNNALRELVRPPGMNVTLDSGPRIGTLGSGQTLELVHLGYGSFGCFRDALTTGANFTGSPPSSAGATLAFGMSEQWAREILVNVQDFPDPVLWRRGQSTVQEVFNFGQVYSFFLGNPGTLYSDFGYGNMIVDGTLTVTPYSPVKVLASAEVSFVDYIADTLLTHPDAPLLAAGAPYKELFEIYSVYGVDMTYLTTGLPGAIKSWARPQLGQIAIPRGDISVPASVNPTPDFSQCGVNLPLTIRGAFTGFRIPGRPLASWGSGVLADAPGADYYKWQVEGDLYYVPSSAYTSP